MKNLIYYSSLLLLIASCKKTTEYDPCALIDCVQHAHCNAGVCECDPNWAGSNCDTLIDPIDSVVGNYRMIGYSHSQSMFDTAPQPYILIDTILQITKQDDETLIFLNAAFNSRHLTQSPTFYTYEDVYPSPFIIANLLFHRPYKDDSIFYDFTDNSHTGAFEINLKGIKIR